MPTNKEDLKGLKKRVTPDEVVKSETKSSPILKKRVAPDENAINKEVSSDDKKDLNSLLKKKETSSNDKKDLSALKKRVTDVDEINDNKEMTQKSSLDKMRERIAAQKKLEQDMMTQQVLHNQEKDSLRSKLNKLNKELDEEEKETVKPNINFDLKSEAIETQNKKLKQDIEKLKNQLQALLKLEFMDLKVLDPNSLTLANDFVEAINNIKAQVEEQKDKEEQSLKDELESLQLELDNLRTKNEEAKKASSDIKRVAMQTQKALDEAKKAIEEQESNEVRNFKDEISSLEEKLQKTEQKLSKVEEEKKALKKDNDEAIKVLKSSLEKEIKKLTSELESSNNKLAKEKDLNKELSEERAKLENTLKELESKNNLNLEEEKKNLENKLAEQTNKIDQLLIEYQKQLDEKDKEIESLRNEVTTKEDELLNKQKEVDSDTSKELEEKCNQYQSLLVSERDSHLQVEQKLCSDLDSYKQEIVALNMKIANMSSDNSLNRLHRQVDSIEQFITELKDNKKQVASNEYYEKIINEYKDTEAKLFDEIERRNQILEVLKQEKIKVVDVLKNQGKNTSSFEKQIEEINNVLNSKVDKTNESRDEINEIVLKQLKDNLMKYCDELEEFGKAELNEISKEYESSSNVTDLVNKYNNDLERMTKEFGNEISKLNIERSLTSDEQTNNFIAQKMLMIEKQYKINTEERDKKFNDSINKLRKQNYDILTEEMSNPYISVVGKEYIKCLNQYALMKKNILDKLDLVKNNYNENVEKIKVEENTLLKNSESIKESIAYLNGESSDNEVEKKELLNQLQINEDKINNLYQYGYNELKVEKDEIVKKLEQDFASIIEEENNLRDLYLSREQEAKNRLEIEKAKEDASSKEEILMKYNEYQNIEEEAERIIESVQERRERIHEEETNKQVYKETINEQVAKDESVLEKPVEEQEVKNVITNDINSLDFDRIKELQDTINSLTFKLNDITNKAEEANVTISRYTQTQKQSLTHSEVKKYIEFVNEYYALEKKSDELKTELLSIDEKTNKRMYRVKKAELKSVDNKVIYYAKKIKALRKKEIVDNYSKITSAIKELNTKLLEFSKEKDNINLEIKKCELELSSLKQKN